ncbi:hypothetical protein KCP73_08745 [Salmonella enterica subsp. enterica]|nr:hypothetical protein KCP73_08745 [Salmonella enterica subsp. enterica]
MKSSAWCGWRRCIDDEAKPQRPRTTVWRGAVFEARSRKTAASRIETGMVYINWLTTPAAQELLFGGVKRRPDASTDLGI